MRQSYLFILRDEENDIQRGIWSLETTTKPGEILSKVRIISARFSYRWSLYISPVELGAEPSNKTLITILKSIGNTIEKNTKVSQCTSVIIRPNHPTWSRDDEHRKTLEK